MASSPDHYREAEHLLGQAAREFIRPGGDPSYALAAAQVHATLALATASDTRRGEADEGAGAEQRPRKRHYRLNDGHITVVADTYREALDAGQSPTLAVAETFAVAHSTAAKWVGQARRRGLLPPFTGAQGGADRG